MTLPRHLLPLVLALAAAGLLATPAAAKKKRGARQSPLLTGDFLPIPPEQLRLESVPFAPGAPAVVLLAGEQTAWYPEFATRREVRRIKILTEAGIHEYSDYQATWWGEVRLGKIEARTILPDGTIVDAGEGVNIVEEKNPDGLDITVTFPRVQVGAILDLVYEIRSDYLSVDEFIVQGELPVLESRFLVAPDAGRRFRSGLARMTDDMVEKSQHPFGSSRMHAWVFRDVPPLPDVPNRPPVSDIARKVLLIDEGLFLLGRQFSYAATWKSLINSHRGFYSDWFTEKSKKTKALARSLAPAGANPRDKAETVRLALRERFAIIRTSDWYSADSPDEALERGRGSSADAALLAILMLRELGVDAYPAAIRLRSSGSIPPDVPVPNLLDELLVVMPGAGAGGTDLTWSPSVDQPVDVSSSDRVGVLAVPYRRGAKAPVAIPDLPAERNSLSRSLVLQPKLDGTLDGTLTVRAAGHHAETWRRSLLARDDEGRRTWIQGRLDTHVPSLRVEQYEVQGLDQGGAELVVDLAFSADGALTKAGGRLLLNPFLFGRVQTSDWAAETRELDLKIGRPRESRDSVLVQLPAGISDVRLPKPFNLDAGAVGSYVSDYSGDGKRLRCSRRHALQQTLFRASAYGPLRAWFTDMAKGDDQSIVLTLAR